MTCKIIDNDTSISYNTSIWHDDVMMMYTKKLKINRPENKCISLAHAQRQGERCYCQPPYTQQ